MVIRPAASETSDCTSLPSRESLKSSNGTALRVDPMTTIISIASWIPMLFSSLADTPCGRMFALSQLSTSSVSPPEPREALPPYRRRGLP